MTIDLRPRFYALDGHSVVPSETFYAGDRHVADDTIGVARVSTVFLSLDHALFGGPPLLFESMVFGGPLDGEQRRYSTWDEAAAGHAELLADVRRSLN